MIENVQIYLRALTADDVTEQYLSWLHDPEVTQYLEVRHNPPATLQELRDYIESVPAMLFLAIVLRDGNCHIGNIKLGAMGGVGILIGEKDEWGKGYGSEAIRLLTQYIFSRPGPACLWPSHLWAGCHIGNMGSRRAFLKAGWAQESIHTPRVNFAIRRAQWLDRK